jgi:hypothetical protein
MRITTGKFCRKCGAAIPPNSPQQSCGACLLETGLGPVEPECETNVDRAPIPMLMDFGDYELLEQIGRGGQGVVFRARQKSLEGGQLDEVVRRKPMSIRQAAELIGKVARIVGGASATSARQDQN